MFDMMKMMGKMKEAQERMKEAQEELGDIIVESESGAGAVKVKVNGKKEVLSLVIDEDLLSDDDKDIMTDLIIAAINKGIQEAEEKSKQHMQKVAQSFMPNIPGMDLSGMV
jgi:hypothetical protein